MGIGPGWVPVEVLLSNAGPPQTAELVVSVRRGEADQFSVRRSYELGRGARRREWFLVPVSRSAEVVRVQLNNAGGERISVTDRPVDVAGSRLRRKDPRVVYVRDDEDAFGFRQASWFLSTADTSLLGLRSPARLPDRPMAYADTDLVILHGADTRGLSAGQREALQTWVEAGGRLLLVPDRTLGWFEQPFLRELLGEAAVSARRVDRLAGIENRYGALSLQRGGAPKEREPFGLFLLERPPTPSPTDPEFGGRWRLRLVDELPDGQRFELAADRACGAGAVTVLAIDPTQAPFDRWRGRRALVSDLRRRILREQRPVLAQTLRGSGTSYDPPVRPGLVRALDSRADPSRMFIVALVVVYIVLVGPLNVHLLRRRNRPLLLVFTVPAISLFFCGLVIASGYWTKGLQTVVWRLRVVSAPLAAPSAVEQVALSLRSSRSTRYEVGLAPDLAALRVFGSAEEEERTPQRCSVGSERRFEDVSLNIWEQACFEGLRFRDLGRGLTVSWKERGAPPVLENGSGLSLSRAVVVHAAKAYVVSGVGPGASASLGEGRRLERGWSQELAPLLVGEDEVLRSIALESLNRYVPYLGRWDQEVVILAVIDEPAVAATLDGVAAEGPSLNLLVVAGTAQ